MFWRIAMVELDDSSVQIGFFDRFWGIGKTVLWWTMYLKESGDY